MGSAVERVEQLGRAERGAAMPSSSCACSGGDMGGNRSRGQAVLEQHPLHRGEAVQGRWVEGRAQKARRVFGIADASRRQAQILELGEPAGDRRPRAEAGRRVEERAAFPRHRIFVAAAEVEGSCRRRPAERPLERHEGVIAVDHDPRSVGPAERGELLDPVNQAAAAEQHLADQDQVMLAALRGAEEALGEAVERLGGNALDARSSPPPPSARTGGGRCGTRRRSSAP